MIQILQRDTAAEPPAAGDIASPPAEQVPKPPQAWLEPRRLTREVLLRLRTAGSTNLGYSTRKADGAKKIKEKETDKDKAKEVKASESTPPSPKGVICVDLDDIL